MLRCSEAGLCWDLLALGASAGCQSQGPLFWGPSQMIQTGCPAGLLAFKSVKVSFFPSSVE